MDNITQDTTIGEVVQTGDKWTAFLLRPYSVYFEKIIESDDEKTAGTLMMCLVPEVKMVARTDFINELGSRLNNIIK